MLNILSLSIMSQTVNTIRKSMSYKDYLLSASSSSEEELENSWGWFIDIEEDTDKTVQTKKSIYIPPTIYEVSSKKSFNYLYEDYDEKIKKSESSGAWMVQVSCIISIVCAFIII